jgi:hypothetical protein
MLWNPENRLAFRTPQSRMAAMMRKILRQGFRDACYFWMNSCGFNKDMNYYCNKKYTNVQLRGFIFFTSPEKRILAMCAIR